MLSRPETIRNVLPYSYDAAVTTPCAEVERAGDEVRHAHAEVGDGGKADQRVGEIERGEPAVEPEADREHREQARGKRRGLLPPSLHQMTGAGHEPRHHTHDGGRHESSLPQVFCRDGRHDRAGNRRRAARQAPRA